MCCPAWIAASSPKWPSLRPVAGQPPAPDTLGSSHAYVSEAVARRRTVVILTHVPPFREACWHEGQISNDDYLPHFACRAVGERLTAIMQERPDQCLTVLCGHTHTDCP